MMEFTCGQEWAGTHSDCITCYCPIYTDEGHLCCREFTEQAQEVDTSYIQPVHSSFQTSGLCKITRFREKTNRPS